MCCSSMCYSSLQAWCTERSSRNK